MLNAAITRAFEAGELAGLHAVLVEYQGERIAEVYFEGEDERWGRPLGARAHGPEQLHDIRSVSKSVTSLLYGIALAEGKVPPPEASLLEHFPQYPDLAADPERAGITVGHALSMKMGTEWNEDLPYSDPRNSEVAMELSDDRYRFALGQPMLHEPGDYWTYNGGAVALVAKLIEDGTGEDLEAYAAARLFEPLGITQYEWVRGADGVAAAASGLRLTAPGLARIGQLILDEGRWQGEQIVPERWLAASFEPRATLEGLRYGYLWWLAAQGEPPAWVAGFGNGGQRLTVQPKFGLNVVVFAGNYNQPDAWQVPVAVIERFVAPEIKARLQK